MSAGMKGLSLMEVLRADRLPECSFDGGRTWETDDVGVSETFATAADRIATLEAEVVRLRGDLEPFARVAKRWDNFGQHVARLRMGTRDDQAALVTLRKFIAHFFEVIDLAHNSLDHLSHRRAGLGQAFDALAMPLKNLHTKLVFKLENCFADTGL